MQKTVFSLLLLIAIQSFSQSNDEAIIRQTLDQQTRAWNKGDIDNFMSGYWQNDSLMFIGKSGVTYGWTNTLNNYKKGYPDTAAMGQLHFTILDVKRLSGEFYHVVGKWHLQRPSLGDLSGHYTLLFRKIKGKWLIILDHSS